ncbi:MAG: cyclase [Dehalococcoidia bacterium]|nr:cyclase [Dehalococcoidia bacterium]
MARVEKDIVVNVPLSTAYNQWTQFEEFPQFMEGVHEVRQLDEKRLQWRAEIAGKDQQWEAVIREQVPDQRIIWNSTTGAENAGMVTFDPVDPQQTRVHLEMSYDPEGAIESAGDALGFVTRRVEADLQRFKDFIEERGVATGAWRGEIENPDAPGGHTQGAGHIEGRGEDG